jgi:peptide/nickel transport system permease protein
VTQPMRQPRRVPAAQTAREEESHWRRQLRRILRNPTTVIGLAIIGCWLLLALAAPVAAPQSPTATAMASRLQPPSAGHLFGTDQYGRDILSRVIWGARISLPIGLVSVGISVLVGVPLGAAAGYFGGRLEQVIMRIMDMLMAFPSLLLAIAISATLGPGLTGAMVAVGVVGIPDFCRLMHGQTLSIRKREFVEAAGALGSTDRHIISRHILPNCLSPLVVRATLGLGFAVLSAASLSFLGLGVRPPVPEWGAMIAEGREFIISGQWWVFTFPGLAILTTVLSLNLMGDGLRDFLDPRSAR